MDSLIRSLIEAGQQVYSSDPYPPYVVLAKPGSGSSGFVAQLVRPPQSSCSAPTVATSVSGVTVDSAVQELAKTWLKSNAKTDNPIDRLRTLVNS